MTFFFVANSISKADETYLTGNKTDIDNATRESDLENNTEKVVLSEITNIRENYRDNNEEEMFLDQPNEAFILVRYLSRKNWTYYVGIVQEITKDINGQHKYTILFYKTVKKPVLLFRKTRLIDRDIVDNVSIVILSLKESPNNCNDLLLAEEGSLIHMLVKIYHITLFSSSIQLFIVLLIFNVPT